MISQSTVINYVMNRCYFQTEAGIYPCGHHIHIGSESTHYLRHSVPRGEGASGWVGGGF